MRQSLLILLLLALLVVPAPAAPVPPPDNRPAENTLKQAVQVLEKAEGDVRIRAELWCAVADLRYGFGDRTGAAEALRKALAVAGASRQVPVQEWRQIAQSYGRYGDAKAVLELAKLVPETMENYRGNPRQTVLQEAAYAAASAGHIKAAEEIAAALGNEATQKWVRESFQRSEIVARAKAGDVAAAIQAARKLPTGEAKVFALVGHAMLELAYDDSRDLQESVASVQLMSRDKDGAKKTAVEALALLPDVAPRQQAIAALTVARMLVRVDDLPAARKAVAAIPATEATRKSVLIAKGYLAAGEVRAGRDATATACVKEFKEPGEQAYLLHVIALAQARAGRKDASKANFLRAIELAGSDPDGTSTTLHNIASAQALAGDFAGAAQTAGRIQDGTIAWVNIASAQAEAGDFAGARRTAERFKGMSRYWEKRLLKHIARLQARAGQAAAAQEWVDKIPDDLERANVLIGLAEGLFREPRKSPGKR